MARRKRTNTPRRETLSRVIAMGVILLAAGGILLLRSPSAASEPELALLGDMVSPVRADSTGADARSSGPGLRASVELSRTAGVGTGEQRVFAEITLHADEQVRRQSSVALAVVFDTSGSMSGQKIVQARQALRQLVQQMSDTDQISILRFSNDTELLWNLSSVAELRPQLESVVARLQTGGGTIIPEALSRAATALERAPDGFVRRVILVSDGQDGSNISTLALRRLVQTATHRGLTFSAMGLGSDYDEVFLTTVADAGAGGYAFIRTAQDLEPFLSAELQQAQGTVVDQTFAELRMPRGWRVERAFGLTPEPGAESTRLALGQLTSGQSRRAIVELVGPGPEVGQEHQFDVTFSYRTTHDRERRTLHPAPLAFRGVATLDESIASRSMEVYTRCEAAAVDDDQRQAVLAWRSGDRARAARLTAGNQVRLQELQRTAPAANVSALARQQGAFSEDLHNFRTQSGSSAGGRAYGLRSNAVRRGRSQWN